MITLDDYLANVDKDNTYHVLEVLKDTSYSRIEKITQKSQIFIRKYYHRNDLPNDHKSSHELTVLSRLHHIFMPRIEDIYELPDKTVLIEEYVEGVSVLDDVRQREKLPASEAVCLTLQLCEIVAFLHAQNPPIIHRDIKPDNIICTRTQTPTGTRTGIKLIDFSIARSYNPQKDKDTVFMGTVGYAPPEQYGFGQTDMRSDIYAIGKTLLCTIAESGFSRSKAIEARPSE